MKNVTLKRARLGLMTALVPVALVAFAPAAMAESAKSDKAAYAERIGASERVNFSGKLRMLSQRVVATSCNYVSGIDTDKSGPAMRAAMDEFNLIVDALEFGNGDLGINGEEKRKKTIRRIGMLRDEWAPVANGLEAVAAGDKTASHLTTIANESAPLLDMAKLLVSDLSAQYSDPNAMTQSFAMLVDISGRQRMLTQRMSKNVCLASAGINAEAARAELAATAQMFETSLLALSGGMMSAGIAPPPNAEIDDGLKVVQSNWSELKPAVEAILAGSEISAEERARVFNGMNQMTGNMNKVVGMYSDASKFDNTGS
ncbi:MAG: type IV pili methyl-accepting chemotaxis transducer N-terminal domain-containing protein [Pseudomonadota bacterium]